MSSPRTLRSTLSTFAAVVVIVTFPAATHAASSDEALACRGSQSKVCAGVTTADHLQVAVACRGDFKLGPHRRYVNGRSLTLRAIDESGSSRKVWARGEPGTNLKADTACIRAFYPKVDITGSTELSLTYCYHNEHRGGGSSRILCETARLPLSS